MKGIEISQRGVSIDRASEWQKVVSSKWKYLKVLAEGKANVGSTGITTIFTHNLGYYAPFLMFIQSISSNGSDTGGWRLAPGGQLNATGASAFNTLDSLQATGGPVTIYYVIFDYDLDAISRFSPGIAQGQDTGGKNDFGMKAVLTTSSAKDMDSTDYRKFSIHTGAKNMAIHQADKVQPGPDLQVHITHGLGYLPSFLFYQKVVGIGQTNVQIVSNIVTADSVTLNIKGAQSPLSGDYYYIILKEPFALGT